MATFSELCSDVHLITNRPDLVAETKLAVRQATLKMHHTEFYPKDLYETGISFDTPALIQSIPYRELIPNWRAFKYLRKYADDTPGAFITMLSPEDTLDRYAINKENICYLAGDQIEVRSNTSDSYMILSCYVHPDITELGFSSWIALEHPFAIIYEAASMIFKTIGWDEQAAMAKQNVGEQVVLLKQSQLQAQGY